MKISVSMKTSGNAPKQGISNVCFRVREKSVDIKVVSEITVNERYWDMDALAYKRNTAVPKDE